MQDRSNLSTVSGKPGPELRRAISRPAWLANRARNALQRPAFIGAISVGTFVTALVSMVVVPRAQRQQPPPIATVARPDTMTVVTSAALATIRLAQAESALTVARAQLAADSAAAAQQMSDTLPGFGGGTGGTALADSLEWRLRTLDRLRLRTDQAPLPASYRALAALPELRNDARVRALLDSLAEIEREREAFGAVGGVNPIFVALTSRLNDVGRAIQSIADEQRVSLRTQLATLEAPKPVIPPTPAIDTVADAASRDSARAVIAATAVELARRREASRLLDLEEERARERAMAVAPPLALLAAAFVLSAVAGFAVAFFGELRKPRVSDANELERFLGVRVLSTVETPMPSVDRGRREADRAAPPYFDPGAEGYQLAYLALATDQPDLLVVTVSGDHPGVAAVIACNLAAVAADEARTTLVVDLEPSCSASAALRAPVQPGVIDILDDRATWPDATVAARVGRDRTVDLVPYGVASRAPSPEEITTFLRRDTDRLARYYDAVFLVAAASDIAAGLPSVIPSPEVVYCAQPGITPLRQLRQELDRIRNGGGSVRGIVLWRAERPLLPTPRELAGRARRKPERHPRVAAATV